VTETRTGGTSTGPAVALVLAAAAAAAFLVGDAIEFFDPAADGGLFIGSYLMGCALLGWASLVGVGCAVAMLRRGVSRRGALFLGAALALVVVVLWTHPLVGSGSGQGT
jgi:hypothetical protein